jgi:hypothetical protein
MREVETLLGSAERSDELRHALISRIAAWVIDHPNDPVDNTLVFAEHLRRLREAVFAERRSSVARLSRDIMILLREEGSGLDAARTLAARTAVSELEKRFGYQEASAGDAATALVRERFSQILP